MSNTVGTYIYAGLIPLLKTFLTITAGYVITRKGLFNGAGAKGAAVVTVNVALPCLVFSSVVPAFNSTNIVYVGPLAMMAVIYIFMGLALSLILREIVFVPRRFQIGFITCGAMSNWNNLPTAVLLTMFTHAPFNGNADIQLGIAFIAVFIVVFQIFYFATGVWKTCAWDFRDMGEIPVDAQGNEIPESLRERWARRRLAVKGLWARFRGRQPKDVSVEEGEEDLEETKQNQESDLAIRRVASIGGEVLQPNEKSDPTTPSANFTADTAASELQGSTAAPSLPFSTNPVPRPSAPLRALSRVSAVISSHSTPLRRFWAHPASKPLRLLATFISSCTTPVTFSILLALPISLVQPLKALFVELQPGSEYYGFALGPDGNPCLAFILNTASFMGGISVPMGLILLGSSFARMKIPRPWTKLPLTAMVGLTGIKCVVLPVIGVALTQYLTFNTSLIPPDALALRFVIMFLSGTPGAVNQLVITQLYSPDGKADTLAAFLLVQYIFMFIGSSALAAVILSLL